MMPSGIQMPDMMLPVPLDRAKWRKLLNSFNQASTGWAVVDTTNRMSRGTKWADYFTVGGSVVIRRHGSEGKTVTIGASDIYAELIKIPTTCPALFHSWWEKDTEGSRNMIWHNIVLGFFQEPWELEAYDRPLTVKEFE